MIFLTVFVSLMDILRISDVPLAQIREFRIQHESISMPAWNNVKADPLSVDTISYQFCVQHCITKNKLTVFDCLVSYL